EEGSVHGQLAPGAIVRLTGETQLVDPEYMRMSIDRSMTAIEHIAVFLDGGLEGAARSKSDRSRVGRRGAQKLMGMPPDAARQMAEVFLAFFGGGLSVRHLPCGPEHRTFAFTGSLANGPEFMADSREVLFAKYGSAPSKWTLLAQVAAVPPQNVEENATADDGDQNADLDRAQLEGLATGLLKGLETAGLTAAPAWPTVSVTPIALYRGGEPD
ncbi:MAG: hypothetical protein H0T54_06005, partial [Geodermatophilaceae bacterium]|nr:hypothetical protein [Geodermatophilaceae bacterium]